MIVTPTNMLKVAWINSMVGTYHDLDVHKVK